MLTLPIKKKWFDMILSGEKKEEHRDVKPYYTSRFMTLFAPYYGGDKTWHRQFVEECGCDWFMSEEPQEICFRNGYSADSPSFVALCRISIGTGKEEWGAERGKEYYVLHIVEVKENRIANQEDS